MKKYNTFSKFVLMSFFIAGSSISTNIIASPGEDIQVLRISGQDERAVIKDASGKTKVVKPGDTIGKNSKVIEIASDRIVLEEKKRNQTEKVIMRLIDGKHKVERLRKTGEQPASLLAPAEKEKKTRK